MSTTTRDAGDQDRRDLYVPTPEERRGIDAERRDDDERERRRRENPHGWWRR